MLLITTFFCSVTLLLLTMCCNFVNASILKCSIYNYCYIWPNQHMCHEPIFCVCHHDFFTLVFSLHCSHYILLNVLFPILLLCISMTIGCLPMVDGLNYLTFMSGLWFSKMSLDPMLLLLPVNLSNKYCSIIMDAFFMS